MKQEDFAPLTAEMEMALLGKWTYEQINFIGSIDETTHNSNFLSSSSQLEPTCTEGRQKPYKKRKRVLLFSFTSDGEFVANKNFAAEDAAANPPEQTSSSRLLNAE